MQADLADVFVVPPVFVMPVLGCRRHSCPSPPVRSVAVGGDAFAFFSGGDLYGLQ
jgi:hypothetical protein